jgi:PAS domain S-box-containing protein
MSDELNGHLEKQGKPSPGGKSEASRQAALFRLSAELAAAHDETEVCQRVVDGLHDTLGYDFVAFFLVEESTRDRVMAACVGFEEPPTRLEPGRGLSEGPVLDGKLQYTPDVNQDPRYFYGMGGSEVDVPVRIGEQVQGVLVAESKKGDDFGTEDFEVLIAASQQAGIAIEKARLIAAERQRGDELDALRTTLTELTAELELTVLLGAIVERAAGLLNAAGGELALYDDANQEVEIVVSCGLGQDYIGTRHKLGEGAMGLVAQTEEPLILEDYSTWENRANQYTDDEIHAIMAVPLKLGKRLIGVVSVVAADVEQKFTSPDVHLLNLFAQQAAIAIDNARLFDEAQREINERTRAEAELREYQELLEERVEARTHELRQSEERYRSLFDGVPVGLYRTTRQGEIIDANPGLIQMLGYPNRDALLEDNATRIYVGDEEREKVQAVLEREGIVRGVEFQLRRYDGQEIWVKDTSRAVKDEDGQVLYYEGGMEDISERKQAELELRKYQVHLEELVEERTSELQASEKRYRTLFDGVPVGLYRSTPEGQILDCNTAIVQMLGFPNRDALLNVDNISEYYLHPHDRFRWRNLMEEEGIIRDFPIQMIQHDGSIIWVNDVARAVRDEEGTVQYYEGSVEDITERMRYEEQIQHQKEYFEALFVNNPVAVVTADLAGVVISWNPMAESLFGYSSQEAVGAPLDDLVAKDESVQAEALGYTNQVLEFGRVQVTTKRTRKDGTLVDVELLALPIIVAGDILGFIAIYYDLTELEKARREAEAANQAKSIFLANMSHELRTPLNAILGFTQLMDRDPSLTEEQQENLGVITRSGEHLLGLINEVLEMSKIEAGQVALQERIFDLYDLLYGLEEMFSLRAEDKGLALYFDWSDDVPRHVLAEEGKLRQILSNLLGNAVKFTQQGEVTLRVRCATHSKEMARLHFEVEDTGPGIAPQDLAVVFDPFVQASIDQRFQEGTGLGLSISRQYVNLMGGDLTARSELGQGSLFQFDLLVELAKDTELEGETQHHRVLGLETDQPEHRLLIAEDNESNRQLLVKLLEPLGFAIREAVNGQDAVQIWEQWEPDLIWMDMRMPIMDGHQATMHIKGTTKGQDTVIIALTATAFEEERERVLFEGCEDFVRKPFREEEIFDMLVKYLDVRFIYEEPVQPPVSRIIQKDVQPPTDLVDIPSNLMADLQEAAITADMSQIIKSIEQISLYNPTVAERLADFAHNYEYKKILDLIDNSGEDE